MYALERLHAELGGKIKNNRKEAKRLAQDMWHVEAVIRMFEPGFNMTQIAAKRRNRSNPWFWRGEMIRQALDVLRLAEGPLTSREIAGRMLKAKGISGLTAAQMRGVVGAVQNSLRKHVGRTVRSVSEGMPARWKLM